MFFGVGVSTMPAIKETGRSCLTGSVTSMRTPICPNSPLSAPAPSERPWRWRLEDADGQEVKTDDEYAGQRFASQADAESWVGEIWAELAEAGVDQVTLLEHDRVVYGPMSLHA